MSVRRPVRMEQLDSHWTDFHKIWYSSIFRKYVEKIQVRINLTRIIDTVRENKYIFMTTSFSGLLRMEIGSEKICRRNHNTRFMFCNFFILFFFNCAVCEIMWKNMAEPARLQVLIWRVSVACWIARASNPILRICNSYCFHTAAVVAKFRLNVSLYMHCLSCWFCVSFCQI